jgi:predicted adenylyl cyclase CyaB
MPSNIEIKARVADFARKCALAEKLSGTPPQIISQRDTFFPCAHGRLKLRELAKNEGQLIAYSRPDTTGARQSDYLICPTDTPDLLLEALSAALRKGVVVVKQRRLYLVDQTRIHLDEVEGLGAFLELEVVLKAGQPAEEGHAIAAGIMRRLEVDETDLIACAYADLLARDLGQSRDELAD